jgi:uncharacterized protein (TIGR02246 family)
VTAAAGDLHGRLARLEAREEIHRLLVDYPRLLAARDFPGCAALFTGDGQFVGARGRFRATGAQEIVALLEALPRGYLTEVAGDDLHLVCNIEIDVLGDDEARSASSWVYIVRDEGDAPRLAKVGDYHDHLRREGGRWRFARRQAPALIPVP